MSPRHLVSPRARLLALALDAAWLLGVGLPWFWYTRSADLSSPTWAWLGGLMLLSLTAVPCWVWLGATPGQLLLSQRVVDAKGEPQLTLRQALLRWLAGWAGLLALGVGAVWLWIDPRRQALQDKLALTLVVDRAALDAQAAAKAAARHTTQPGHSTHTRHSGGDAPAQVLAAPAYGVQHWLGELSLGHSLFNALLLPLPLFMALGAVDAWIRLHGSSLRLGSLLLLLGWPLLLALLAWGLIGVWRAAQRPARRGATRLQSQVVRVLATLPLLAGLLLCGLNIVPRLPDLVWLVLGKDPAGVATIVLSADGHRLRIRGPLGLGDAERVRAVLQAAPQLRLLAIESAGGRLTEARRIADLVRARGLPTRATGDCTEACPLVFLAGSPRQLLPGARLGFHRLSAGRVNPPYQGLVNRELRRQLAQAGLTRHLVTKALATPPSTMWFPEADELSSAGLVSVPDRPLDVDLPAPQGAALADYAEALSVSPLWQRLEQRFPGTQAEAAARMQAASSQGVDAVQAAGHDVVAARLPPLLARASPELRWLHAELLTAQVAALRLVDPAACRELLQGGAAAHRRLPSSLAWREAEWLLGALGEAPPAAPPRRPTALELEVVRHTLGPRAPAQLAALWQPQAGGAVTEVPCDRAHALLTQVGMLSAPQRRLAIRLMYERE